MIRVAIVDDHQLFADGLATALHAIPDIAVIATFSDGSVFLSNQADIDPDVVLLDLEMPQTSGLEVLTQLSRGSRAIIVSMHAGSTERAEAHQLGAAGFLSKSAPLKDVAAAIRAVHAGANIPINPTTLREVLDLHAGPILDPGAASLTHREREVLGLLARGVTSTDELAESMYISAKTVKNHLASISDKLAISDRAQAAVEAIRLGLKPE
jgi:DNA-binding NarL/FixJ family response regulator